MERGAEDRPSAGHTRVSTGQDLALLIPELCVTFPSAISAGHIDSPPPCPRHSCMKRNNLGLTPTGLLPARRCSGRVCRWKTDSGRHKLCAVMTIKTVESVRMSRLRGTKINFQSEPRLSESDREAAWRLLQMTTEVGRRGQFSASVRTTL